MTSNYLVLGFFTVEKSSFSGFSHIFTQKRVTCAPLDGHVLALDSMVNQKFLMFLPVMGERQSRRQARSTEAFSPLWWLLDEAITHKTLRWTHPPDASLLSATMLVGRGQ